MVQPPRNQRLREQRSRNRARRRKVLVVAQTLAVVALVMVSAAVALGVFAFHMGFRPVLTGSMRPDYGPGAVIVTRRVPVTTVHPGMIVLFVPPGEHVDFAHRVATVTGPRNAPVITTKGDANKSADPWHAKLTSPTVTEVVGSVPLVGRLVVGMRGIGQILLAILGSFVAAWAGTRWILGSTRPSGRRVAGST